MKCILAGGLTMLDMEKDIILAMADYSMNVSEVSKKLYYGRATIDRHIRRIKKETGLDPKNFYDLNKLLEVVGNG